MPIHKTSQGKTPTQAKKKPRYWLLALIILVIFGVPAFFIWKTNVLDNRNPVSITCTVTSAEKYTQTTSGKSYSSSTDYLAFDTSDCHQLLLRFNGSDDYQSMISDIHTGQKYEFSMGPKEAVSSRDTREVLSYSGPK